MDPISNKVLLKSEALHCPPGFVFPHGLMHNGVAFSELHTWPRYLPSAPLPHSLNSRAAPTQAPGSPTSFPKIFPQPFPATPNSGLTEGPTLP